MSKELEEVESSLILEYIERVERLKAEIAGLNEDIKEVFAEAKSRSLEPKALRKIIAERAQIRKNQQNYETEKFFAERYRELLGMG